MKFRGFRIHIILIACALVIAVGFGARELVFGRHVNKVVSQQFTELPGVEAVQFHERGSGTEVVLVVGHAPDFPSLYTKAAALATERFGSDAVVTIEDDRDEGLQEAYDRIHLALYEGATTGRFVEMERRVLEELSRGEDSGADYDSAAPRVRITVDEGAIYVELSSEDGRLYERIGRRSEAAAGSFGGMWP